VSGQSDRVELVDEADCAAVLAGRLPQRLEVLPDLALGRALEAGLEGRGRGEQERDSSLGGERLGGVGLAGAWAALEQQATAWPATHLAGEPRMGQEQLQRPDDLVLDDVDADHVLEAHVQLLGADHQVRRAAAHEELPAQQQDQHDEEQHRRHHEPVDVRNLEEVDRVPGEDARPQVGRRQPEQHDDPEQPAAPQPLAARPHVGGPHAQREQHPRGWGLRDVACRVRCCRVRCCRVHCILQPSAPPVAGARPSASPVRSINSGGCAADQTSGGRASAWSVSADRGCAPGVVRYHRFAGRCATRSAQPSPARLDARSCDPPRLVGRPVHGVALLVDRGVEGRWLGACN
jgi:hypothetical protein